MISIKYKDNCEVETLYLLRYVFAEVLRALDHAFQHEVRLASLQTVELSERLFIRERFLYPSSVLAQPLPVVHMHRDAIPAHADDKPSR